jgi:hypothetical protein
VSQPEPDFEAVLLSTQLHGAHCRGEYLSLVVGIAVLEDRSQVGGMVAELPESGEGVGLVRLSLDAPELLLISFLLLAA